MYISMGAGAESITARGTYYCSYPSLAALGLSFFIGEIKIIPPAFLIQQIFSDPSTMNTSPDTAQGLSEATV